MIRKHIASALCSIALLGACTSTTAPGTIGITRRQFLIIPASTVEKIALTQYAEQNSKAKSEGILIESGPEYERLKKIGSRLISQTKAFRGDTQQWKWQLTLIDEPVLNASCAPGGKITFYTGIIRQLHLSDAEIAAIMGHEIAHALREHGREKVSEAMGQQFVIAAAAASSKTPEQTAAIMGQAANLLLTLPNSRDKETEADRIGLELMARAGYDPAAAINVWRKMSAATQGKNPPQFLSTHPSGANRIADLTSLQAMVRPLYDAATKP